MKTEIKKQPKATYKISVEHSQDELAQAKQQVLMDVAAKTRLPGFREGKAPVELVAEKVDQNYLGKEVMNHLMRYFIPQIIRENKLSPITSPHINVTSFEPFSKLTYEIELAERPEVTVGDYKGEIKKFSAEIKSDQGMEKLLEALLKVTKVELPDLMIQDEAERMLSRLVESITQVGLTLENYLKTRQMTVEELQQEYRQGAEKTLKSELALAEVIKNEKIEVTETEIEEALKANPDDKSREDLGKPENLWYIESVLARQKAISKLLEYTE